uniref:Uncharacterized protein n=1 Tax=Triticum urartu TaxID=4572 RepID=A0A8R7PE55_TRIUA
GRRSWGPRPRGVEGGARAPGCCSGGTKQRRPVCLAGCAGMRRRRGALLGKEHGRHRRRLGVTRSTKGRPWRVPGWRRASTGGDPLQIRGGLGLGKPCP